MKVTLDLPEDVMHILVHGVGGIPVNHTCKISEVMSAAVSTLAHSYDAIMEDQGVDNTPFTLDPLANIEGRMEDMPSEAEVQAAMDSISQPAIAGDVIVGRRSTTTPTDKDGLVSENYVLVCGAPVVADLLSSNLMDKDYDIHMLAIRYVFSSIPEDVWAGVNVPSLVTAAITKLKEGKQK